MRESGILLHLTSLPGPYGVGTMGENAYKFIEFLKKAGQSYWQILPLTPTGYGDSPYQSCSTFAGNHYLIDLDTLCREGLLARSEIDAITWCRREDRVDFGLLYEKRLEILRLAYGRFSASDEFDRFCRENGSWLPDFALFMALKTQRQGKPWYQWEEKLKRRDPDALWQARQALKDEIRFYCFVQYLFQRQWAALRAYAHDSGIRIIGDVPIYVPMDSADVWANPELFDLDEDLAPVTVAGCPPDGFGPDGQLWGNPIYRWDVHKHSGYNWWLRRMSAAASRYDVIRLDHFRGFESYWAVPSGDDTARNGRWCAGPGMSLIGALQKALPDTPMIAEDLGFITPEVKALRTESGYPGMKVLEFAFDSREPSDYLPHTYTKNTVCYTGTHDNMTLRQWFETAPPEVSEYAAEYMGLTEAEGYVWGTIRTAMASVSALCVVQMQDYLELGGDARMNFPGTRSADNWTWRATAGFTSDLLAEKIRRMTGLYCRLGIHTPTANPDNKNGEWKL